MLDGVEWKKNQFSYRAKQQRVSHGYDKDPRPDNLRTVQPSINIRFAPT